MMGGGNLLLTSRLGKRNDLIGIESPGFGGVLDRAVAGTTEFLDWLATCPPRSSQRRCYPMGIRTAIPGSPQLFQVKARTSVRFRWIGVQVKDDRNLLK